MKRKSSKYGFNFVEENMRDPNSWRIREELAESLRLENDMNVLDLWLWKGIDLDISGKGIWRYRLCHRPEDKSYR
jgi:hypothetical protein